MNQKIRLFITDSYYNVFNILTEDLKGKSNGMEYKNLVFCEEKISLMAERAVCDALKGSFNTDVYSFGNYLRRAKPIEKTLSKEGSAMAVKRILQKSALKCFYASKKNLAPSLYELIAQLKSAKVSHEELFDCTANIEGSLKNKLTDIASVYEKYEEFIEQSGLCDQSKILSFLPQIIENDKELKNTDVYLLGYTSFTGQIRDVITALIKTARSVTAILTGGNNGFLFLNETADAFRKVAKTCGEKVSETFIKTDCSKESGIILKNIFSPLIKEKVNTNEIYAFTAKDIYSEIKTIAETIKLKVMESGARYSDFIIAIADKTIYKNAVKAQFGKLNIPYFLDEKICPDTHPLIKLIIDYITAFDKNLERECLSSFYKNPLFCNDKNLTDRFYNYTLKYNVNYSSIKKPFLYSDGLDDLEELEAFRKKIVSFFDKFDINKTLKDLEAECKIKEYTKRLVDLGEPVQADINRQIYQATAVILGDMEALLGDVALSFSERLNVFTSGVYAMELSVIPQFKDAVFIGGYRETALAKSKYLFAVGLTDGVPSVKEDVALINDDDINRLSGLKVLVEPKIKVVNARAKENLGVALASFDKELYLSYPLVEANGKKTAKGVVLDFFDKAFTIKKHRIDSRFTGYLTKRQGLTSFALGCGRFAYRKEDDFSKQTAYYKAVEGDKAVSSVLDSANAEIKVRLNGFKGNTISGVASPTMIEEYYKCPYRAFVNRILRVKEREEGKISASSLGNFMHAVFNEFLSNIKAVEQAGFEKAFNEAVSRVAELSEYARYFEDCETDYFFRQAIEESKKFCVKFYNEIKESGFTPKYLEFPFEYRLLNGKVKLKGKIDRVDVAGDYYRIIDYKTGSVDAKDSLLFSGTKLQLYLYASAFKDKKTAGLYYAKVADDYGDEKTKKEECFIGKTVDGKEDNNLPNQEGKKTLTDKEIIDSYVVYAEKVCQKAVEQMDDGVIVSSPFLEACRYCKLSGMCQKELLEERTLSKVDKNVLTESVKDGEEDA